MSSCCSSRSRSSANHRVVQKLEYGTVSRRDRRIAEKVPPDDLAQNGCRRKIGCGHSEGDERGLLGVHIAELAGRDPLLNGAGQLLNQRSEILARDRKSTRL